MTKPEADNLPKPEVELVEGTNNYTRQILVEGEVVGEVNAFTHHVWLLKEPYSQGASVTIEHLKKIVEGADKFVESLKPSFEPRTPLETTISE